MCMCSGRDRARERQREQRMCAFSPFFSLHKNTEVHICQSSTQLSNISSPTTERSWFQCGYGRTPETKLFLSLLFYLSTISLHRENLIPVCYSKTPEFKLSPSLLFLPLSVRV